MGIIASVAARELGISPRTLAGWADSGKIKATKTVGGWRLYDPRDVSRLKRDLAIRRDRRKSKSR